MSTMDVSRPYAAVCPTLDGDVLRVLAGTSLGLTGREVAVLAGRRSHSGVLSVLHRLSEHGLVTRVQLNRSYLFALNREHIAAEAVEALMSLRAELFERIRKTIAGWQIAAAHVSVFGSAARSDGDTDSDIDLLVVRPTPIAADEQHWQAQVDGLRQQIEAWTGNRTTIVDISESELAALDKQQRPIVSELRTDAIALYGADLTSLLDP